MPDLGWFAIFKGGKQTDSTGTEHDGDELIKKAVENFKPGDHEPPIVLGHPKTDAPAFGWVNGLKTEKKDGVITLYAKAKQVPAKFIEWLKKGLYKKRSASFYPSGQLRHIGFLGAAPPAVKGLPNIFAEGEEFFNFEEDVKDVKDPDTEGKTILEKIKALLTNFSDPGTLGKNKQAQQARAKKYGIAVKTNNSNITKPGKWQNVPDTDWLDPVNYRYPMPDAGHVRNAAARLAQVEQGDYSTAEMGQMEKKLDKKRKEYKIETKQKEGGVNMTEEEIQAKIDEKVKAEKEKLTAAFAEKEKKRETEEKKKGIETFLTGLKKDGKLLPAWEDAGLSDFAVSLAEDATVFEFTEGKEKIDRLTWFQNFMEQIGKVVDFSEVAKKEKTGTKKSEFDGMNTDEDRVKLNGKVKEYMAKHEKVEYAEALNAVIEMEE